MENATTERGSCCDFRVHAVERLGFGRYSGRMRVCFVFLILSLSAAQAAVDFNHQIVPMIRKHCAECHTGDKLKGGFSMNDRAGLMHGSENGPVVDLKQPSKSRLLEVVTTDDEDMRMPPKGAGLSTEEVKLLEAWLKEGVPWEVGFAFNKAAYEPPLKPRQVTLPPAVEGREHPVDRLLDKHMAEKGLPRPPNADDDTFLRRAFMDLIGLLPTPEEHAAFVKDTSPDKRIRLVRELLARDVDYAEHWLTFWNDLLRNDYGGTGFITGGRKQISQWLYAALVNNKPFDAFTRELIAPPSDESRGFIDGIKWRGEVSAGQTVEIQFAQSVGQSFLGINLKCASCHDSFIDRWKLDEAYGLAAIYAEAPLEIHRCDKPVGRKAKAAWLFPELGQVDATAPKPERLRQLAALMTSPENGRFTRTIVNRLWHRLMGHGIVHPLDAMQSEPWNADLLDYLADHFQRSGYDLRRALEHIATSQAYQSHGEVLAADSREADYAFKGPRAKRLTAEQFVDAVWQLTGAAPTRMDAPVFRGKLDPEAGKHVPLTGKWIWGSSAAAGKVPPAGETIVLRGQIKLEDEVEQGSALLTCDNEFTLYIGGRKVQSSNNWERLTTVPLQGKLQKGVNQVVVVATNAGSSPNPAGFYFQAKLKLMNGSEVTINSDESWQWNPARVQGREGRLGALPQNGWNPVTVVPAAPVWTAVLQREGPALLAQGLSASKQMVRAALMKSDFLMRSLGRPNRDQIVSMRPTELTTLEALDLSNGETLATTLQLGADKLAARAWKSNTELTTWLYTHALSRAPTKEELSAAEEALSASRGPAQIEDLLWAVVMQPEFLFVR